MRIRDSLSITADIATILGVSIAWFIGTPIVSELLNRDLSIFDFMSGILFYFIFLCIILIPSRILIVNIWQKIKSREYFGIAWWLFLLIVLWVALTGIFNPAKQLWGYVFVNEYFFPKPAIAIIEELDLEFEKQNGHLQGKIKIKNGQHKINVHDYRILTYLKYHDDDYFEVHRFIAPIQGGGGEEELEKINTDNSFVVPGIRLTNQTQGNKLEGIVVSVITRFDGGFRRRYPPGILSKNSNELDKIGAYSAYIDIRDTQQKH